MRRIFVLLVLSWWRIISASITVQTRYTEQCPDGINAFTQFPAHIEYLNIKNCTIYSLYSLQNYENLKTLDLSHNIYKHWFIRQLTNTTIINLNLSSNEIGNISLKELSNMNQLKVLSLSHNKQIRLRAATDLALEEIYMDDCNLESVPEELLLMERLRVLDLASNEIKDLPENLLNNFPSLKRLYLAGNKFKCVEEDYKHVVQDIDICETVSKTTSILIMVTSLTVAVVAYFYCVKKKCTFDPSTKEDERSIMEKELKT